MHRKIKEKKVRYYLNEQAEFVIENYNYAKPFANFFPGIAGKYGIPMWVFYVNRAQAISSFGTKGKGHAILEFQPANKSWESVSQCGFRTFIKLISKKDTILYEPFHNGFSSLDFDTTNSMRITSYGLCLEETNRTLGLKVKIEYFNIPNDSYAGLARIVTITNLSHKPKSMQVIDGLPKIVPFGTNNLFLKQLSRTIEAWMHVKNLRKGVPFYNLSVDPTDRPEIIHIKEGHFYLGFHQFSGKPKIIKPIVDSSCVFGENNDFSLPQKFLIKKNFLYPQNQITSSKTPCAFLFLNLDLAEKKEKSFSSITGCIKNIETLNLSIKRLISPNYLKKKQEENKTVIEGLQADITTLSSSTEFNLYAKQTYLDNIMRGGYPVIFKFGKSTSVFYLYSRKHGDLERDYNRYVIQPTYFSQGNGNYRDINQNRRCDIWFNPDIKEDNLVFFLSLLQLDGFNPLIIKGANFLIKDETYLNAILKELIEEKEIPKVSLFLKKPFSPGELILFFEENKIKLKKTYDEFLSILLSHCAKTQEAEHKEGFWTDHWAYNLDLLENYLTVYPEKLKEIVFENKSFTYFDGAETVRPRKEKYLLYQGLPKQLGSLALDNAKAELIGKRPVLPNVVRTQYGNGNIYQTNLLNKLLCLLVNKLSSLDPFGIGIEMEANKPNWYDSLNGLPALFGSSLCETLELKRLILVIKDALEKIKIEKTLIAQEVLEFLFELDTLIKEYLTSNSPDKDFQYWDRSYSLKETYREKTRFGISGKEIELEAAKLLSILENTKNKIDLSIEKAYDKDSGLYNSYFINEVTEYTPLKEQDSAGFIRPLKFSQKKLPLFLEGQMHALRLAKTPNEALSLHKATKSSELFDKKLKMYKVTSSLLKEPEEIGRCRIFSPGWLENESIWLHMEYKYLLELLKAGLHQEFYADFKNCFIPFQKPERYGRSILENSSFLVSSKFPDKNLHGNGFVARLSGSTAEFIQIWLTMNLGNKPFFLNEKNELNLRLSPILPGWLFDKKGMYGFNFLRQTLVIYHNPKRENTFGRNGVKPKKIIFNTSDGKSIEVLSNIIPSPYAEQIRSSCIKKIEIYLDK
ncbi:MAG: cellobiose phosphorylase [Candidatus Omnitrophota bacterium]|nr:cellobiose phosphorylase [Candidatus Omnitrophota bacterium]